MYLIGDLFQDSGSSKSQLVGRLVAQEEKFKFIDRARKKSIVYR